MTKNLLNIWRSIFQRVSFKNKYVKFILRVLIIEIGMLVRIMVYWMIKVHRAHARHIVYNYMLQNNVFNYYLKKYNLKITEKNNDGYVEYEEVSYLDYLLYKYLVWIWLDDTAECDTYHEVMLSDILSDRKLVNKYADSNIIGPSYNIGDLRISEPMECLKLEFKNIIEYENFNLTHEIFYTTNIHDVFSLNIFGITIGYKYINTVDKKDVYKLIIEKNKE